MADLLYSGAGSPRRAGSVHSPLDVYDRSSSVPRLVIDAQLQEFLFTHSSLRSLAHCGRYSPCRRRICPWCAARRVAARSRQDLRAVCRKFPIVLFLTLTTSSREELAQAWDAQKAVRSRFFANSWVTQNAAAWFRETEITVSEAGWHVHDNVLLFLTPADLKNAPDLVQRAKRRWVTLAGAAGVGANRSGQDAKVWEDSVAAVKYATKGLMIQKRREVPVQEGYTPADVLALWIAGDADAASWWQELETLFRGPKRFKARGGNVFRD